MSILKTGAATKAARFAAIAGVVGASLVALSSAPATAASTTAATVSPNTGNAAGGTILILKGKGFQDATGTATLLAVRFSATACSLTDATAGTAGTPLNVTSSSAAYVVTPVTAAGAWYVCGYDGVDNSSNLLAQATYTTGAAPSAATFTQSTGNVVAASTAGGAAVTVNGTDFTSKTAATVDGVTAKTTYVSDIKLSVTLPKHSAATGLKMTLTSQYGSTDSGDTITYFPSLKLSPAYGSGTVNTVITVTGSGFKGYSFGAAIDKQVVAFVPAGVTLAGSDIDADLNPCGNTTYIVVSDTTLTCKAPALTPGPYTVMILTRDHTTAADYYSSNTTVSRSAIYTVSNF